MPESCDTLEQFTARYSTELACVEYLFHAKWPDGFVCPRCGHQRAYHIETRRLPLFECVNCRHQASLIAGTIMEGSRTSLPKWFLAVFLVSRTVVGINAVALSRIVRVTYKTAWLMLHKIRHAMSAAMDATKLSGIVHVNAFCYGKPYNPSVFRHPQEQPLLAAATVNDRQEPVRLHMQLVPNAYLHHKMILNHGTDAFIVQTVDPGRTDLIICSTTRFMKQHLMKLRPLFLQMNRWIHRTFCGIGPKHLQAYLDEFSCRYNLFMEQTPIFGRLVHLCARTPRVTYSHLTSKTAPREFPACRNDKPLEEQFAPFSSIRHTVTRQHALSMLSSAS